MTTAPTLVELDSRRRVALGKLARHDRYLATQEEDGTLVLTPAEVMTEMQAALLRKNPDLVASLEAKMAGPGRLRRRSLPPVPVGRRSARKKGTTAGDDQA